MKKVTLICSLAFLAVLTFYSCTKNSEIELAESVDQIQLMDAEAEPALPDLIVSVVTSNLPINDGPCPGGLMADATCDSPGGSVPVQFTAIVRNITGVAVLPGEDFDVDFCLFGGGCTTTRWTQGVPANGSITVLSTPSALPCPSGAPPYQLIERQFYVIADTQDEINEFRENNNYSRRYFVCDDED